MSIDQDTLNRAIAAAKSLEAQGYFEKARQGDQKAASLFARHTAYTLNPSGDPDDYGCLSKSPGESQVDGFAEDAICYTDDPADRQNVVDLINGAGAPNASIGGSVKERRENNKWVRPQALSVEQMTYLRSGGMPPQPQPPMPTQPPGREEALDELNWLHRYYQAPEGLQRPDGLWRPDLGTPDFEGIAAWYLDVYQRDRMAMKSRADSRANYVNQIRHSDEWKRKHPGEIP